jgi:organic radical activating enzyme
MDIPTLTTDITKRFTTHNGYRSPLVIITGGEPMLQNNVVRLIERLLKIGYQVQIESNGDRVARDFSKSTLCNDAMLVVSPKVNPASKKYNKLPKEVFYRADYLKFVVEADPESSYHNLPDYVPEWNMRFRGSPRVYVSPATSYSRPVNVDEIASIWTEGLVNIEETRRNYAHAAQLCREFGYRLSCQLHTLTGIE